MNNYKIKLNNEAESKEAQDLFEQLGFTWAGDYPENGDWYSHLYAEKSTCCHLPIYVWNGLGDKFQELTLPQLRDLVVLHRNDVNDATHSCGGMNGAAININGSWYGYNYFKNEWQLWGEIEDDEYKIIDLKPIQPESEQGLISGADALRALADGKDVEYLYGDKWFSVVGEQVLITSITENKFKFRLKPRTITLNGIEIPAPFEPKVGEFFFVLYPTAVGGYSKMHITDQKRMDDYAKLGAWRTEEEIKQVVAALRGGIKA